MGEKRKISLVVADVDGTLVTEQKVLTQRAQAAVQALHRAGIRFAITSGRPPRGMAMLFDALDLETPIAGFNGGLFIRRDLSILEQKTVEPDIARQAVALIREHGLDAWIYRPPGRAGRGDRDHRRPAERRADVQAIGAQHRHGQCLGSGQVAGGCHDGFI